MALRVPGAQRRPRTRAALAYLVSLLALFFYGRKNRRPSKAAKEELDKWFWSTILGNRYTGRGFRPNVTADGKFLLKLGRGERARFPKQPLVPLKIIRDADYLIPHGVGSGLRDSFAKRDYQTFLDVRTRLIAKTFEALAGVTLFRRD